MFSEEHFDHWSVKMKTVLVSEIFLWEYVEEGYEAPNPTMMLSSEQKHQYRENSRNDGKALSIIQRGLSSSFFPRILNAKTAKEVWDILHMEFQMNFKMDSSATDPDITHLDEEGITPLLGVPFYDLVLSKAHMKPAYHMSFPPRMDSALPLVTVPAIIICFGKHGREIFVGIGHQKALTRVGESLWMITI